MGNLGADTVLKDRYQIKSELGKNALGITYEGMDTVSGSRIVVRELFPEIWCSRTQAGAVAVENESFARKKAQFIQQMQLLAKNRGLNGIVDVHDVFEERGTAYCIMEYVEGVSLEKYLTESGKRFPVKRIKELVLPVVESLSVLHKEGVIHQNISPDNLIFTKKGDLKLIGFGCIEGQVSNAGAGYVPVELYRRQQEVRPAADIYALCASIYRCITGVVPQDAYARLNNDQLRKPSQLGVGIEADEEAVLMMGLNLSEEKRFQMMAAFQNAFYRKTVQQPSAPVGTVIQTNNSDTGKKKQKQPRQKKSGSGGMIAIAVVGSILVIGLGISAFILGKNMLFPDGGKGENILANRETETGTEEEFTETESEADKEDIGAEYEQMLESGDFSGVLDKILALDTTGMTAGEKDTLSDLLSRAVAGQYTEFENRVNENQNTGAFESAFAAVDEELALYDRIASNPMAVQYVDRQKVEDKRAIIKQSHIKYLLGERLDGVVGQENETELEKLVASLQGYVDEGLMSQEEFDNSRNNAYSRFVLAKITRMSNAGTDTADILTYINEKLADTGNNSSVLEYWDYFQAVMGYGAGNPALVHPSSSSGYLLPDSDSVNLTANDIRGLSNDEMRLAIYEIFARHGKIFQDQAVNNYFKGFGWYQPSYSYDESALNAYEKFNLNLLIEYQISTGYR